MSYIVNINNIIYCKYKQYDTCTYERWNMLGDGDDSDCNL